jgi:hypothetical protein
MSDDPSLLPACWTVIAERGRNARGRELLLWHELPGAQLRLEETQLLAAKGAILMSHRYFRDRMGLVIPPALHG